MLTAYATCNQPDKDTRTWEIQGRERTLSQQHAIRCGLGPPPGDYTMRLTRSISLLPPTNTHTKSVMGGATDSWPQRAPPLPKRAPPPRPITRALLRPTRGRSGPPTNVHWPPQGTSASMPAPPHWSSRAFWLHRSPENPEGMHHRGEGGPQRKRPSPGNQKRGNRAPRDTSTGCRERATREEVSSALQAVESETDEQQKAENGHALSRPEGRKNTNDSSAWPPKRMKNRPLQAPRTMESRAGSGG